MTPPDPKIYHITHVDNLAGILSDGALLSDAAIIARGGPHQVIGMTEIKRRRIQELDVSCHPGTKVGNFPFTLIERIGVETQDMRWRVAQVLGGRYRPQIEVLPQWYF